MPRKSYNVFFVFLLLAASTQAATNSWTGGTGNWSDASNWTNGSNQHLVPVAGDDVQIINNDGVSRTITYDNTVPVVTLGGLTVDLTGGTTSDTDTLSSSSGLIVGGNEVIGNLGSGTFAQAGTHAVGGSISIGSQIGSTGTYTNTGNMSAANVYVGGSSAGAGGTGTLSVTSGSLSVSGTLTAYNTPGSKISLSGSSSKISATALNFNGTPSLFNWTAGTLSLNSDVAWYGGAPATSTSAAFGTSLSLNSSQSLVINGNETIGGLGLFSLNVSNSNSVAHVVTGTLTVAQGGTLSVNYSQYSPGPLFAQKIIQAGGTITGTLVNSGNFVYQSGSFSGTLINRGDVNLGPSFTASSIENDTDMTISGNVSGGFDNFGNLTLAGGTIGSGTFTNEVSGSVTGHGSILGGSTLTNNGRFTLDGLLNVPNSNFVNNGILQGNGTLSGNNFSNGNSGIVNVANNSALSFTTNWTNPGLVNMQGSGALLGGYPTFSQTPIQITNTGTIQGSGTIAARIVNNGILRVSGGDLNLTASNISTNTSSSIQIASGCTLMFQQGLQSNSGTITLTGGIFDNNNHTMTTSSSSAVINGYGTIRTAGLSLSNSKLNVGGGNMEIYGSVNNQGTIGIQGGRSVYFYGNVSGNGSFTGTGTATFLAALSPGNSPATVSFGGNVDLSSTASTLNIELGGTTAGTQYDRLNVAGQLVLGGALNVSLINNFKPISGNTFDILNWNSLSGTFAGGITLPSLTGAVAWDSSALYTTGALSVIATYYSGDFNRDGHVNAGDILSMESAIADLDSYQSAKGLTPAQLLSIGDVNNDGVINSADLQSLLTNIKNGGGSADPVPEPCTWALFASGLLLFSTGTLRKLRRNCR